MENIISIEKNNDELNQNYLKLNLNRKSKIIKLIVEEFAVDSLRNQIYFKLAFSNIIIRFDTQGDSLVEALLNLKTKNKAKIVEQNNIKNWKKIPYKIIFWNRE